MRLLAFAAIVLGLSTASNAAGQVLSASDTTSSTLRDAAFAPRAFVGQADPVGQMLERDSYTSRGDPVRWRTKQVRLAPARRSGAVDSLRVTTGETLRAPGGLPLARDRGDFDNQAYEVALIRDWPAALNVGAGQYKLDVSPHAGLGYSRVGGTAEAGAMVRLGKRNRDEMVVERLNEMGVRDGASFGDQGRWYLFAAASGRAIGLNMLRSENGWSREGWSTDPSAAMIADAQVGVGWRRGDMQTSFGYVRREVKGDHRVWGQETRADSLVAVTFSIRPGR